MVGPAGVVGEVKPRDPNPWGCSVVLRIVRAGITIPGLIAGRGRDTETLSKDTTHGDQDTCGH